jgi:hypothetical protein
MQGTLLAVSAGLHAFVLNLPHGIAACRHLDMYTKSSARHAVALGRLCSREAESDPGEWDPAYYVEV